MSRDSNTVVASYGPERPGTSGFSLLETLVVMGLGLAVTAITLTLFQHSGKVARSQTWVAEMQDSLRQGQGEMIRVARMAGRGGMPLGVLPRGLAVQVENDTPSSGDRSHIAVADPTSPKVLAGTDVLIIRGVIATSVYQSNPLGPHFTLDNPASPTGGTLRLFDPHPTSGIPQDLAALVTALEGDQHPALLLVGPADAWAVVEIDLQTSDLSGSPGELALAFVVGRVDGTSVADQYAKLSGGYPPELLKVSHAGLLEERRFYVREQYDADGDGENLLSPRLAELRFYPNTQIPHPANSDFNSEIADNILDLQVTIGIDRDGGGWVDEGIDEAARGEDEWLFNSPGDVDASGAPLLPAAWNPAGASLRYLRLTTLARTDRPELGYMADLLTTIEDRDFSVSPHDRFNQITERRYRRRQLQTVIDMRNL